VESYQVGVKNEDLDEDPNGHNNILCVSADGSMKEVCMKS